MSRDTLLSQLQEFGALARRQTYKVASAVYRTTDATIDRHEFKAYSESAALFAFTQLGGDPEHPDEFDWAGLRKPMIRATQLQLNRILKGADQPYSDLHLRVRARRSGASCEALRWSSWHLRDGASGQSGSWRTRIDDAGQRECHNDFTTRAIAASAPSDVIQASADLDDKLAAIGKRVAAALKPDELALIRRHYFDGESQFSLAKDLAENDPRYAGPDGVKRAYNAVMVKICRARKKLRAELGEAWSELKQNFDDVA